MLQGQNVPAGRKMLVCGGRKYWEWAKIANALDRFERPGVVVDSGTICEDGTEAIALRIVRPYMGMRCKEMTYIPKGSKWIYGCNVKAKGPAPKPI